MKKVVIPASIKKEIGMALAGKKIVKKNQVLKGHDKASKADLLWDAEEKFNFISNIANTEPLRTLIVQKDVKIFIVSAIGTFLRFSERNSNGSLILRKLEENVGVYYWHDADYPANRSESDYEFLSKEKINTWHWSNLEILAMLNEKKIWTSIKKSIRAYRMGL